jgi:transcriptional regulator with XRE-family HTH domain
MTDRPYHLHMPERSFGRTVRYRRTKLGLSQVKLGDLVGRSVATVRSWEAGKSTPNDPKVITTLSAILGVDERMMFNKAGLEPPVAKETSPTIEQALASLAPEEEATVIIAELAEPVDLPGPGAATTFLDSGEGLDLGPPTDDTALAPEAPATAPLQASSPPTTTGNTPLVTMTTGMVGERSYLEDASQKQLYRVRTLGTIVALVALVIALLWAAGEGLTALGDWWEDFFGTLRL